MSESPIDPELHVKFGVEAYQTSSSGTTEVLPTFRFGIETIETPSDDSDSSDYGPPTSLPFDYSDEDRIELKELVDPGPFLYNKRVSAAAIPCILLLLVLGGEMLMIITTLGAAFIILLDHEGENRKCVIVFVILFIPSHIYVLVTVFPLMWLSIWNFFLILAVNGALLLTASWIIIQFISFRKEEPIICELIEQLLFTAYPIISVILTAWMFSTVLPISVIPLIVLLLGFVMLQLFLAPVISSFKMKPDADEDMNVVQQPIVVVMVLMLLLSPSILHVLFAIFSPTTHSLFTSKSFIEFCFLGFLSLFLLTLLSIRQLMEYIGIPFSIVVKVRYIGGAAVSLLCYPVLQAFGLTSHFLPWLPVAIVGFSVLGIILSLKKYKMIAVLLMTALTVLMAFWTLTLPWKLQYYFLDYLPIHILYGLFYVNFVLCLMCMYIATYGSKETLGLIISVETIALVFGEICLQKCELTRLPLIHATGIGTAYMLHRLYTANKLSQTSAIFGASIHLTKVTSALLDQIMMNKSQITLFSSFMLFCLICMSLRMFIFDNRTDITQKQTLSGLCCLLLALAGNVKTVLTTIGILLWLEQPPASLLIGLWFLIGGLLVLLFIQFHPQLEADKDIKKGGLTMLLVSIVVFIVQPDIEISLYCVFQWCELTSILILAALIFSNVTMTMKQIILISSLLSICPALRFIFLLYESDMNIVTSILYVISTTAVISLLISYVKIESFTESIETYVKYLSVIYLSCQFMIVVTDILVLRRESTIISMPSFKSMLGASLYSSIILKLLSFKKVPGLLPVVNKSEVKSIPMLPIIGNISCFLSFLLLCLQGPVDGFLHDMWCCGASLIFVCLQRDVLLFQNLREYNQTTPTSVAAISVLVVATIWRNLTFSGNSAFRTFLQVIELLILPCTLPVYIVLWVIMWRHDILSEKMVVFCLPLNAVLFLASTTYTAVILSLSGISIGIYMIGYKLPMVPYSDQDHYEQ